MAGMLVVWLDDGILLHEGAAAGRWRRGADGVCDGGMGMSGRCSDAWSEAAS